MKDRRLHASYPGMDIVRYDRAGKWYLEPTNPMLKRQRVSMGQAVQSALYALENDGTVFYGVPGGQAFYARLAAAQQ